ncbi:MAG: hypothetical protein IPJ38_15395 [Dechloromonas sp.]|uniref:MobA/VirD2-like nuclease domain-containing protein n=1 Tax=Candidatus Dechloromonas phosphorivorans TaxID=2899244 RepID=A0A935N271_9RHOO|nr:hypothetical protein [Candidatus Dechloromonas phosphorivorans]
MAINCAEYLHRLGLNDSHQYAVFLEDDVEGQHVHIVANRISASGQVYLGRNENLATTRICAELERKFGLRVTPEATADESGQIRQPDRRSVTSRELQKAVRTDEVPARIVLQQLIEKAWTGRPATEQFVDRLAGDNVRIVPNVASTGRVSGMRFSIDGELWFSGSQLGAAYKWGALCERIDYDKDRDAQCLGDLKDANTSVATSGDVGDTSSRADAIASRELEPNDPAEPAPGWDGGGNGAGLQTANRLEQCPDAIRDAVKSIPRPLRLVQAAILCMLTALITAAATAAWVHHTVSRPILVIDTATLTRQLAAELKRP